METVITDRDVQNITMEDIIRDVIKHILQSLFLFLLSVQAKKKKGTENLKEKKRPQIMF